MPKIYHRLLIEASAEKVYSAITTQQGLSAWWTPHAEANDEINSLLRFPFGDNYFKEMKVTELTPLQQVKWHCQKGDKEWIGTNISFTLVADEKGNLLKTNPEIRGQIEQQRSDFVTLLIFEHDDWADYSPTFAECNYTWGQFLRSLKLLCETGKGKPWPNQHKIGL